MTLKRRICFSLVSTETGRILLHSYCFLRALERAFYLAGLRRGWLELKTHVRERLPFLKH